jgi:hypothetical protein
LTLDAARSPPPPRRAFDITWLDGQLRILSAVV